MASFCIQLSDGPPSTKHLGLLPHQIGGWRLLFGSVPVHDHSVQEARAGTESDADDRLRWTVLSTPLHRAWLLSSENTQGG